MRTRRGIVIMPSAALALVLSAGCAGGYRGGAPEMRADLDRVEVTADAYLFDARLVREGKPTSVRLEIYYTDTLIGLGGRGYLGKGALKGWLREDSLRVYFPGSNEYVYEAVPTLLESDACAQAEVRVPLAGLLSTTPDSLGAAEDLEVEADYVDPDEPRFVIRGRGCPWRLEIRYDRRDDRWQVKEFRFADGADLWLTAQRRTVKHGAKMSAGRFAVAIPENAVRIVP